MKTIHKFSVFLLFGLIISQPAHAEILSLGTLSSQGADDLVKDLTLKIADTTRTLPSTTISQWTTEKNDLEYNPQYDSEIENANFCQYKKSIVCALTFSVKEAAHLQKTSILTLETDNIKSFVEDLARQVNKDPIDAKLKVEDGKASVFSLSEKGIMIDEDKSIAAIINHFQGDTAGTTIDLPFTATDPEITTDAISNMGITSLLGEGHSNFRGSPKNRIFNIKVATNRFNGILIKPNEDFSFVKVLGEVDGEHGYLPELVIKKDKTEPEFGGGICQVSTTAFRAAIYSGLKITARRNHAYPVSYYNPQGMDSTVYVPRPDLRFINNTPGYILIQTEIVGTELIFRFFGTSDGRRTNIIGPTILERNPDGSMKTTFTQQVFDANNNMTQEDIFNSSYDSPSKYPHPGQILTQKPADWSESQWKQYQKDNKKP